MKKYVASILFLFFLTTSGLLAIPMKFDVSLSGNIGKYFGIQNKNVSPPAILNTAPTPLDMRLQAFHFGGGFTFDFIFITENRSYYGVALSVYTGIESVQQNFATDFITKKDDNIGSFTTNSGMIKTLSILQLELAPIFRFYPTRDVSIGIGPSINFIINKGDSKFINDVLENGKYSDIKKYYINPMFGSVYISAILDVQITKFFGNFGIFAGGQMKFIFIPFSIGVGGQIGIKYRFEP